MDRQSIMRFLEERYPNRTSIIEQYEKIIGTLEKHIIPDSYPQTDDFVLSEHELGIEAFFFRDRIIELSGFALLSYNWIRPLAQWIGECPCLEIMAGSGALTFALKKCGVDIVATDYGMYIEKQSRWFSNPWCDVERIDCLEAIRKYSVSRPLIICSWPDMDDKAYNALMTMRETNPKAKMIYIGEGMGIFGYGATANADFLAQAESVDDPEFENAVRQYKQYTGIHDFPYLIR